MAEDGYKKYRTSPVLNFFLRYLQAGIIKQKMGQDIQTRFRKRRLFVRFWEIGAIAGLFFMGYISAESLLNSSNLVLDLRVVFFTYASFVVIGLGVYCFFWRCPVCSYHLIPGRRSHGCGAGACLNRLIPLVWRGPKLCGYCKSELR